MIDALKEPPSRLESFTAGWDARANVREAVEKIELIAKELHYPECWDTMAYPTIYDALMEMARCSECDKVGGVSDEIRS